MIEVIVPPDPSLADASQALARPLRALRLPVLQAPMFRVSSLSLARACSSAGVIGSFQLANPRDENELRVWLDAMDAERRACAERGEGFAPYCVNVNANSIERPGYRERVVEISDREAVFDPIHLVLRQ